MPQQLLFEGADLEVLLAQVRAEHGHHARIVKAERVRSGGVGGFFAKERYELTVTVDSSSSPSSSSSSPSSTTSSVTRPGSATPDERPDWAMPAPPLQQPPARAVPSRQHIAGNDDLSILLERADASDASVPRTSRPYFGMVDPVSDDGSAAYHPAAPDVSVTELDVTDLSVTHSRVLSVGPREINLDPTDVEPVVDPPRLSTQRSAFDEILKSVRAQLGGTEAVPADELPAPRATSREASVPEVWQPPQLVTEARPTITDVVSQGVDDLPATNALPQPRRGSSLDTVADDPSVAEIVAGIVAGIMAKTESGNQLVVESATATPADSDPDTVTPREVGQAEPMTPAPTAVPAVPRHEPDASVAAIAAPLVASATPLLDEILRTHPATSGTSPAAPALDATTLACALSLSGISPALSAEVAEAACVAGPLAADVAPILAARRLVTQSRLPSGPGDVIVVAGSEPALAGLARALGELLAVDETQMVTIGEIAGMPHDSTTGSAGDVSAAVQAARAASSPLLLFVPTAETMAGARRTARTAAAVEASGVIGAWDSGRDPYDGQRWLATVAGSDDVSRAMALTGCADAGAVAGTVTAGCDVILLDGRPATAGAWAALLVDRLDQIVGAGLVPALGK